jgi:hypothetical protein
VIAWPAREGKAVGEAEPVETPGRALAALTSPPVEADSTAPAADTAPALPPAPRPIFPQRRLRALSAGLVLALAASAALHAGGLVWLVDRIARPGSLEASVDAVRIELVLEEPPATSDEVGNVAAAAEETDAPAQADPQSSMADPAETPEIAEEPAPQAADLAQEDATDNPEENARHAEESEAGQPDAFDPPTPPEHA